MSEKSHSAAEETIGSTSETASKENDGLDWRYAWMVPSAIMLVLGFLLFPASGRDDNYIVYWPAHSLAEFGKIINYDGTLFEQHTSLGHVLLLGLVGAIIPIEMETLGPILTILGGVACFGAFVLFRNYWTDSRAIWAAILLAGTFPFVYWAFGGLESTFIALAYLLAAYVLIEVYTERVTALSVRFLASAAGVLVFLFLMRPESVFVFGLACFLLLAAGMTVNLRARQSAGLMAVISKPGIQNIFWMGILAIGVFCVITLLRVLYFGGWDHVFPQPVVSKTIGVYPGGHEAGAFVQGIKYIAKFSIYNAVLVGLAAWAGIRAMLAASASADRSNSAELVLIALIAGQLAFNFAIGGDWMEGSRFIVPVTPLIALLAAGQLLALTQIKLPPMVVRAGVAALAALVSFGFYLPSAWGIPIWHVLNGPSAAPKEMADGYDWFEVASPCHQRDIQIAEKMKSLVEKVRAARPGPVTVVSGQAGFVLYHTTKTHYPDVRFVDVLGLGSNEVSHCEPLRNWVLDYKTSETNSRATTAAIALKIAEDEVIRQSCDIPNPDIIYMLGAHMMGIAPLAKNGYVLVHHDDHSVSHSWAPVKSRQWIMMRADLAANLGVKPISPSSYQVD